MSILTMRFNTGVHQRVDNIEALRTKSLTEGHRAALRAPANRSKLNVLEHDILRAIGAKIWNDACAAPVNYDVWISEAAYQAEAWARAMRNMQAFYSQAAGRKGIKL